MQCMNVGVNGWMANCTVKCFEWSSRLEKRFINTNHLHIGFQEQKHDIDVRREQTWFMLYRIDVAIGKAV